MSSHMPLFRRPLRDRSRAARTTIVIGLVGLAAGFGLAAASGEATDDTDHTPSGLPADLVGALEMPALQAYGPRPHEARQVGVAGEMWTLIPADDAGWCVDVGDVTVSCGRESDIEAGAMAITQIAAPVGDDRKRLAEAREAAASGGRSLPGSVTRPTEAVRRGIAPAGTWEVRAIDAARRQIAASKVAASGAYVLALGVEGRAAKVEFSGADGVVLAVVPAY